MATAAHTLAANYFRRLGLNASAPECDTLGAFIQGLIDIGVLGSLMEGWIHRSTYNKGSGATSYGFMGRANMSLVSSPTWSTSGIVLNGSTQYGTATLPKGVTSGSLIIVGQGVVGGEASFAALGSLVAPAGRSAAGGGAVCQLYHNSTGPMSSDGFTGTQGTDLLACSPAYNNYMQYFRMFGVAVDSTIPAASNWCDYTISNHATPRTMTNLSTMVTNGALFDNPGYSLFYSGTIALCLAFSTPLTDAQMQAVYALIRRTVGSGLSWVPMVVIEGDSQGAGSANAADTDRWNYKLLLQAGINWYGKGLRTVQATGGQTAVQRLAAYNSAVFPFRYRGGDEKPWCIVCEGANDLVVDTTADTLFSTVSQHLALMRRDGFKTIVTTLPFNLNLTAYQNQQRLGFNERLRNAPRLYDYLVDLGAKWPAWNGTDYLDNVHLGPIGNTTFANLIVAKVASPWP
jgi:hypothetical protein